MIAQIETHQWPLSGPVSATAAIALHQALQREYQSTQSEWMWNLGLFSLRFQFDSFMPSLSPYPSNLTFRKVTDTKGLFSL